MSRECGWSGALRPPIDGAQPADALARLVTSVGRWTLRIIALDIEGGSTMRSTWSGVDALPLRAGSADEHTETRWREPGSCGCEWTNTGRIFLQ
jgi:hypothetical protein